jgi:hypothetical protein
VNEANRELSGGSREVELKINALEKGSFNVDVELVESVKQIFSKDSITYIASLCTVIGGTYGLYKWLKGKPVKTEEERDKAKTIIGNANYNVTINVYNQPPIREAISKSIETADSDVNVEGFSVDTGTTTPVSFERDDFKSYIYDDFDKEVEDIVDEKIEDVDATLTIIGLNFEPGSKWQFMFNGFKIPMIVRDDALMTAIDEGERFGKGDAIHVKMRILKRYNKAYKTYENKSYKIIEFYQHIDNVKPVQGKLDFPE